MYFGANASNFAKELPNFIAYRTDGLDAGSVRKCAAANRDRRRGLVSEMFYEFTLVLDHRPTDEELDQLFDQGCSDAGIEYSARGTLAHFDRQADSLTSAISSAVHAVERAGFRAIEVRREGSSSHAGELEYAREIAAANMMVATRIFLAQQRSRSSSRSAAPA